MSASVNLSDREPHSKKPSSSRFKQQKLPAWQPILTAGSVMPTFFVISILFIPIGIGLLYSSNQVKESVHAYTDCEQKAGGAKKCSEVLQEEFNKGTPNPKCECDFTIKLDEAFPAPVYLYYQLTNFYQNHRRYVKSRDDFQLLGDERSSLEQDCEPYRERTVGNITRGVAPCGAIANSLFNDTFKIQKDKDDPSTELKISRTNIAWNTDRDVKFKNPPDGAVYFRNRTFPPVYWPVNAWDLRSDDHQRGFQNEELMVWMRTAALPTFRKLYGRVVDSEGNEGKVDKGEYHVTISYSYPVDTFSGTKTLVLSTTSWLGGKNNFLGIAYITVGSVCLLLGIIFLVIHVRWGKTPQDLTNIDHRTS